MNQLALFFIWCHNIDIKQMPNPWWTRYGLFRDAKDFHSNSIGRKKTPFILALSIYYPETSPVTPISFYRIVANTLKYNFLTSLKKIVAG